MLASLLELEKYDGPWKKLSFMGDLEEAGIAHRNGKFYELNWRSYLHLGTKRIYDDDDDGENKTFGKFLF